MILVVAGTRTFTNRELLREKLTTYTMKAEVEWLHVGSREGADRLALEWAYTHSIDMKIHHADWDTYKKAAGPIRNREMLEEAGPNAVVVCFWNGTSPGTKDLINQARKRKLRMKIIRY